MLRFADVLCREASRSCGKTIIAILTTCDQSYPLLYPDLQLHRWNQSRRRVCPIQEQFFTAGRARKQLESYSAFSHMTANRKPLQSSPRAKRRECTDAAQQPYLNAFLPAAATLLLLIRTCCTIVVEVGILYKRLSVLLF